MVISYYGYTCFKLQSGDTAIAIDPYGKGSGLTPPRFEAKVALFTDPKESNNISLTGDPHIFSTPGEYEVGGNMFTGIQGKDANPFYIEFEGIKMLHLGSKTNKEVLDLLPNFVEVVDILFVPAGSPEADLNKIIGQIDPRIIIPMQPADAKKNALETLVKELGKKSEKLDKLSIKEKDLQQDGQRLITLSPTR
ncbi:MAG: MBL fold metallo-hydrolase [bacterium]|nr:MBL fold metallo-hydrolase [bacterium]